MTKKENLERIRHSASHALASAVLEMFPEAKLGIGPNIKNGFYYDFELPRTLIPEDLEILEKKMTKFINKGYDFVQYDEPKTKALEFLKKVKSNDKYNKIPFILLTAKDQDDDVLQGFEGGADDYVRKPCNIAEVMARARNLIKMKCLQDAD